jgi:hypothetical protein
MPTPGEGRPLAGQLDTLAALFDFEPTFAAAISKVTSPDSDTRRALHELVCITSTRLHIERAVLSPLLAGHPAAAPHRHDSRHNHHRVEVLLALIDRRGPSDPTLLSMFEELQVVVRSNLGSQQAAITAVRADLTAEQTDSLRHDLRSAVDTAMTRPHPHLPHQGGIGKATRAVTARLDRLRNHTPVR